MLMRNIKPKHSCFNPVLYTGKAHSQYGRLVCADVRRNEDIKKYPKAQGFNALSFERHTQKFSIPTARSYTSFK